MMQPRLASRTLTSLLAAVLALPYAAPAVCGITGRMQDSASEMPAGCPDSAGAVPSSAELHGPGPSNAHCEFEQCGATVSAPVGLAFGKFNISPATSLELPPPVLLLADF